MNAPFENYVATLNAMYENAHKSAFVRSTGKNQRLLVRYNSHLLFDVLQFHCSQEEQTILTEVYRGFVVSFRIIVINC